MKDKNSKTNINHLKDGQDTIIYKQNIFNKKRNWAKAFQLIDLLLYKLYPLPTKTRIIRRYSIYMDRSLHLG